MSEFRIKLSQVDSTNIEIIPCKDGGVELVVHYTEEKKPFKFHEKEKESEKPQSKDNSNIESIISQMKVAARVEYKLPNTDRKELEKFVAFWENKIRTDGWKGSKFDFDKLFERWMSNKR